MNDILQKSLDTQQDNPLNPTSPSNIQKPHNIAI